MLGHDVAGVIAALGPGVDKLSIGLPVMGLRALQHPGTYAEFVTLPADAVTKKPSRLSFVEAATLPLSGTVALQAIRDRGRLQSGQALLVNGAAGGIGSLAVQIGKALGAVVTGVCSGDSAELVRSLGVDQVLDFEKEDLSTLTGTFDVVLDTSGQLTLDGCRKMLRPQGRFIPIVPSLRTLWNSITSRFLGDRRRCRHRSRSLVAPIWSFSPSWLRQESCVRCWIACFHCPTQPRRIVTSKKVVRAVGWC